MDRRLAGEEGAPSRAHQGPASWADGPGRVAFLFLLLSACPYIFISCIADIFLVCGPARWLWVFRVLTIDTWAATSWIVCAGSFFVMWRARRFMRGKNPLLDEALPFEREKVWRALAMSAIAVVLALPPSLVYRIAWRTTGGRGASTVLEAVEATACVLGAVFITITVRRAATLPRPRFDAWLALLVVWCMLFSFPLLLMYFNVFPMLVH